MAKAKKKKTFRTIAKKKLRIKKSQFNNVTWNVKKKKWEAALKMGSNSKQKISYNFFVIIKNSGSMRDLYRQGFLKVKILRNETNDN